MKTSLQCIRILFVVCFKLLCFSFKALWLALVTILDCLEHDPQEDEPVVFSYSDDDTRDPNCTTVTGKTFEPGQSIPMYESL